jgi:5-(carboxyamino)imidazole ribonucleotide mutase
VGTLAIGKPGAANAALFAAQILATTDEALRAKLQLWRDSRRDDVLGQELEQ